MTNQTNNTPQHRTRYDEHTGQRITEVSSDGSNWRVVGASNPDLREQLAAIKFGTDDYDMPVTLGDLPGELKQIMQLIEADKAAAVHEAEQSILRGFRRRDFVRGDFYEHAIIERLQGGKGISNSPLLVDNCPTCGSPLTPTPKCLSCGAVQTQGGKSDD